MRARVEAGHRDQQITLQVRRAEQNTYGEAQDTWIDRITGVWAYIEPLSGREYLAGGQTHFEVSTRINIHFRFGISPQHWRVKWGNRLYTIVSVIDPETRHESLDLMCKEIVEI